MPINNSNILQEVKSWLTPILLTIISFFCKYIYFMKKKLNKLGVENSLWNNIRANKGSGKAPTKEMIKQEKKIKSKTKK